MKLTRKTKQWLIFVVSAVLVLFFVIYFLLSRVSLPSQFLTARKNAAVVSQKIVDLTNVNNEKIRTVNALDFKGDVEAALTFIRETQANNAEAYAKASELATHLQKLAESLAQIQSRDLQRTAYESVAVELSLVSEFIIYTQKLNYFLDSLARAVATDSFVERRNVDEYLKQVNEQAQKINSLNKEFLEKISAFDKSL